MFTCPVSPVSFVVSRTGRRSDDRPPQDYGSQQPGNAEQDCIHAAVMNAIQPVATLSICMPLTDNGSKQDAGNDQHATGCPSARTGCARDNDERHGTALMCGIGMTGGQLKFNSYCIAHLQEYDSMPLTIISETIWQSKPRACP